jgi:hypothetical protein
MIEKASTSQRIRPKVLALLGIAVLVFALSVHVCAFWPRWAADRISRWGVDLPLDLANRGRTAKTFSPIVTNGHSINFLLTVPLEGDLAAYKGKDDFLTNGVPSGVLSNEGFRLSWQLLSPGGDVLAGGAVGPADLKTWAMRDHLLCQQAWGLPKLERGVAYSLVANVDQIDLAASPFAPTLHIYTWDSLKGRQLLGWRSVDTALTLSIGLALIIMALVKRKHESMRQVLSTSISLPRS